MRTNVTTNEISFSRARSAPRYPHPGGSTAFGSNVAYRLGKLRDLALLKGVWLDCGCADGGYTEALVAWGVEKAIGVDPEQSRIDEAVARKRVNDAQSGRRSDTVEYHCCTDNFPLPSASIDAALMNEVLEHVSDERATLSEIYRVLRPGGHLVVMSPNRWFPFEGHGMQVMGRKFSFPIPLLPWLPSSWGAKVMAARNYWPYELRNVVAAAGFRIERIDYVLPVFELYRWMPSAAIAAYRRLMPVIERTPLRKFGVSTLIVATRPLDS